VENVESLSHTVWDCKYHVVFLPKCRRKVLHGKLREYLGKVFRALARQRESEIEEGHLMPDHVHTLISIPPKYSVAQVMGFLKGRSAIYVARNFLGKHTMRGHSLWARGYYVSTVGRDEEASREYIRKQEAEDQRLEQLQLNLGRDGRLEAAPIECRFERLTRPMPPALPGVSDASRLGGLASIPVGVCGA
jgi:REP-associated tyrosine transposase